MLLIVPMAALLLIAGIAHLLKPNVFLPLMPPYLPWHRELIYFTGVVELAAAVGLFVPQLQYLTGICLVVYFIAITPAHWHVATHKVPMFGVSHPAALWGRVAFQAVLLWWAWAIAQAA